jgi:peroxiredoxin
MNVKEQFGGFFLLPVVMMLFAACDAVPPSEATSRPELLSEPATIAVLTEAPRVGHMAPDFVLQTLDGREARLSDYRGHVVFLNFWATWCAPCRVEMPAIEQLYRELRPKGFSVLAVSTDPEGPTVTRPYRDALGLTFTIAHDPEMQVGRLFGVRALPLTFVVDRQGIITHQIFGSRDWTEPEARNGIRKLLLIR